MSCKKDIKNFEKVINEKGGFHKAGGYLAPKSSIVKQTQITDYLTDKRF